MPDSAATTDELVFLPLGGCGEIGMNLNAYGYGPPHARRWIVVGVTFVAPDTGVEYDIFGTGGGQELAEALGTELLGRVPIDLRLREGGDDGTPMVLTHPDAPGSKVITAIAADIMKRNTTLIGRSLPLSVG